MRTVESNTNELLWHKDDQKAISTVEDIDTCLISEVILYRVFQRTTRKLTKQLTISIDNYS